MPVVLLAIVSSLGVSLLSLCGIALFALSGRLVKRVLLYLVSFSTGAILGDVSLHMLPEMTEGAESVQSLMMIFLMGILFSFLMEKVIRWRHCHELPDAHGHTHHHHVGIMNLIGDGVHNFIDGLVIGASFLVSVPIGISTTFAIAFHEIPHEIGDFAVLVHSGYTRAQALRLNVLSGLTALAGTLLVLFAATQVESIELILLPFAAGNLLYIAAADLIPELHRDTGIRSGILQVLCMAAGIGVMYVLLGLE